MFSRSNISRTTVAGVVAVFAAVSSPAVALAVTQPSTFRELANQVATILDSATTVLIVAGIAIYFYGVSTNILKFGEKGAEKIRAYFVWGVIVLFVMVSIWGILALIRNTIFGNDQYNPSSGVVAPQNSASFPVYAE
ncbi:MAG: hypothetical protein U1D26_03315 [Patescibacteria group bacterium]|nr:hypothetical protein [bacterium]MDZ4227481.1 hypothetical protein [Patescibacteria group bacterium]